MKQSGAELADADEHEAAPRGDALVFFALFLAALGLRLAFAFQYQAHHPHAEHPVIDEASYDRWARAIAAGDWIGHEVFFQEPLYPYVVGTIYALFGPERFAVRVFQCVLGALTAVLLGWIARRAFGRAAGFLATGAWAVYEPALLFPCLLLKENAFVAVLAALAWSLVRTRGSRAFAWLWIGTLAGLGALLRGNMLVLLPVIVLWPIVRALVQRAPMLRAAKPALCIAVGALLVLLPVALRNHHVGGVLVLTTSGAGTNVYGGNNAENPYGRATEFSFVRGIPEHEAGDWRREAERRIGRALDPAEVSAYWLGEVWRSVQEAPALHAKILWNKLRLSLGNYEVPDNHSLAWDARYLPLARAPFPGFGVVGALGLAGIAFWLVRRFARLSQDTFGPADPAAAIELALLGALYLGTVVLTVTSDRARWPLCVVLVPFAGYACVVLARALVLRHAHASITWLASAAFAGLVVHTPVLDARAIAEDHDERDYNLAVQWLKSGEHGDGARAIAIDLSQRHPSSARVALLAADVDYRRAAALVHADDPASRAAGRLQIESVLARVERFADEPSLNAREWYRARCLSGWIRLQSRDFEGAERRLREALAFDPDDRALRTDLAAALLGAAEDPERAESAARVAEAAGVLVALEEAERDPLARANLALLVARSHFMRGRILLADASDDAGRAAVQREVQAALEILQPLADASAPVEIRRRARALAGWIQLFLRKPPSAAGHFRASLALGSDPGVELGLAQALLSLAERTQDEDERARELAEVTQIVARLSSIGADAPGVAELKRRLDTLSKRE
ncbi:MAG: glycosyltransferase family 39 protein [Planctomycetota bacterium]